MRKQSFWIFWGCLLAGAAAVKAEVRDAFRFLTENGAVPVVVDSVEASPVRLAARDMVADLQRVTGGEHLLEESAREGDSIVVGQVGAGGAVDALVEAGAFDARELEGEWESFVIEVVATASGRHLVIAGSDPRGTVYGIYEVARVLGVSPWHWWADVPVRRDPAVHWPAERQRFGPPSVRYRGIFINDEDWALHPWAAKTFDPEFGDIGPRTYERVFELVLRLRGNTLWPAMHEVTRPFNADARNAELAHRRGIIMSSSHAEPMLRNNVREWTRPHEDYNYTTHREAVLDYWEERVRTNQGFENIYTLGMRGIHDSGMQGGASLEERVTLLEQVIADQRQLLARHVDPQVENVPQIFVAYKEVLELYRAGLELPPDVTVVWPDDNFGYIRDFATPEERSARPGEFGVYNHISYLGRPLAYLWLNTTPPALIWEEMKKAHAHGADRFWILNVGDIKPGEIGIDFFFELAWDTDLWTVEALPGFLPAWAEENFGPAQAGDIARILDQYYLLNFRRKPEHLQFYLPREAPALSDWSEAYITERLVDFAELERQVSEVEARLQAEQLSAFHQLVAYPVRGSSAANRRYFWTERFRRAPSIEASHRAWEAEAELQELTRSYNEDISDGKWRHMMVLEPADDSWRSMRIAPLELPPPPRELDGVPQRHQVVQADETPGCVASIEAADFARSINAETGSWQTVPGLGRTGRALTVLPFAGEAWPPGAGPRLEYAIEAPAAGRYRLVIELLPTFPLTPGQGLRLALSSPHEDDAPARILELPRIVGQRPWSHAVLQGFAPMEAEVTLKKGTNRIRIEAIDRGVVIDRLRLLAVE